MTETDHAPSARVRWARLRFQIVGPLLAAPADAGELKSRIEQLAARAWRHPTTGGSTHFSFKTIERWWYIARAAKDPFAALARRVHGHAGTHPSIGEARADLLVRRLDARALDTRPGLRAPRAVRGEADAMALDVARAHAIAARLETRLLASPLATFTPGAAELLREALRRLAPVLRALDAVIGNTLGQKDAA